ncbi:MAG: ABC-F family ATP-binding cassette domain-containing protein [Eubacterium sp.]|nr:ABC-F family ATP-binding cassette domain-containing protein [Eubacterium sp.]
MIKVEKLSYSVPEKKLYDKVSFTIEAGQHIALIGSNGTGKTTLVDMIMDTEEEYLYKGKIIKAENIRMGYVSQFAKSEKEQAITVFDYLCQDFLAMLKEQEVLCDKMATETELDDIFEQYQNALDAFQAVDGDNYESNIHKQLKLAGLTHLENLELSALSGGEYKLLQVIKQMLMFPSVLIMDEPDVFLDFENLNGLRQLINSHTGTLLVITHNRYLLNNCFDKILHLENAVLQEFEGSYIDYRYALLEKKIELQEQCEADLEEIARNQKVVERMRLQATRIDNAALGRALHARVSYLERLQARRTREPFIDVNQPEIIFPVYTGDFFTVEAAKEGNDELADSGVQTDVGTDDLGHLEMVATSGKDVSVENNIEDGTLLTVSDYSISFDDLLLEKVSFDIKPGEKIAIVGPNGTGKTTLLREIYKNDNPSIKISDAAKIGFLSQLHGEMFDENHTVFQEMEEIGFDTREQAAEYLETYLFDPETLDKRIHMLSGGEKNLLQISKIALMETNLLLLDEPTSHLDTYAQEALEKAIAEYMGAVLMVSHDFYNIANSVDYVLLVEDKTIRRMSNRAFRKMIYAKHFDRDYLELEQKKKELEIRVEKALKDADLKTAKKYAEELEPVIAKFRR